MIFASEACKIQEYLHPIIYMNYKFCPNCKGRLYKKENLYLCKNCSLKIYIDSAPCAGILPIKDGKVLLSKRADRPFKGHYDIVGGFLNPGEHPEKGAEREAKEETGLEVKAVELLGIYMDKYGKGGEDTLNIHYLGKVIGGKIKAADDAASLHWISIKNLPKNKLGFKNTQEALRDLRLLYTRESEQWKLGKK